MLELVDWLVPEKELLKGWLSENGRVLELVDW